MTDQTLSSAPGGQKWQGTLARLVGTAQGGWRRNVRSQTWFIEICVLIAIIMALTFVLHPRIHLLAASPHPFWLPVIAASLIHGSGPGIVAASLAGICAWLYGGGITTTEEDFYDLMLRAFKEPVLWLFAAILLGTYRDRIEDERQRLASERNEVREDLGRVVDHAKTLRTRIDELERSIVLQDLDRGIKPRRAATGRARPAPRPMPVAERAETFPVKSEAGTQDVPVQDVTAATSSAVMEAPAVISVPALVERRPDEIRDTSVVSMLHATPMMSQEVLEPSPVTELIENSVTPRPSRDRLHEVAEPAAAVTEREARPEAPALTEETTPSVLLTAPAVPASEFENLFVGTVTPKAGTGEPVLEVSSGLSPRLVAIPQSHLMIAYEWAGLWRWSEEGWTCQAHTGQAVPSDIRRLARHFEAGPRILDSRVPIDRLLMPSGAILAAPIDDDEGGAPLLVVLGGAPLPGEATAGDLHLAALGAASRLRSVPGASSC